MMRAALARGVVPEAFWRLSLLEWRWLIGEGGEAAMTRAELEALDAAFGGGDDGI